MTRMVIPDSKLSYSRTPPRADINHVGWFMRIPDAQEVFAASGDSPVVALHESWAASINPYLFYWDNKPTWCCGVAPLAESIGSPWMLATDTWEYVPKKLLWRLSRHFIDNWLKEYSLLTNYVDARNGVARDWLSKLGASEEEIVPYGYLRRPFIRFEIKQPCANP